MNLKDLGEEGLIERIRKMVGAGLKPASVEDVVMGIGDDAAVLKPSRGKLLLVTTDSFVEGVHFDLSYFTYRQIGKKALAASLSDIAAMGGVPVGGLLSLFLPLRKKVEDVDEILRGILEIGNRFGMPLVGGNIVRSKTFSLSLTILGEVEKSNLTLRSGAKVGDILCVTGELGRSHAGLVVLSRGGFETRPYKEITKSHLEPTPRILEARALVRTVNVHSMIDLSDGLSRDLHHLTRESGVGARVDVEKIPIGKETEKVALQVGIDPLDFALHGGEDFELLFSLSRKDFDRGKRVIERETGTRVTVIGEILPRKEGVYLVENNKKKVLRPRGFQHF